MLLEKAQEGFCGFYPSSFLFSSFSLMLAINIPHYYETTHACIMKSRNETAFYRELKPCVLILQEL